MQKTFGLTRKEIEVCQYLVFRSLHSERNQVRSFSKMLAQNLIYRDKGYLYHSLDFLPVSLCTPSTSFLEKVVEIHVPCTWIFTLDSTYSWDLALECKLKKPLILAFPPLLPRSAKRGTQSSISVSQWHERQWVHSGRLTAAIRN
jgi:hypothetical protein